MHPQPLFSFTLFNKDFGVYPYGLLIAIGIVACLIVFYIYTKKVNMLEIVQDFIFFVAIFAIAIGFLFAALYQAIYHFIDTGIWEYNGITVMGGLLGGAGAFILAYFVGGNLYFKGPNKGIHKPEFNSIFRVAPICITIAHGFGRLGCLMAGCCYGKLVSKTENSFGAVVRYTYNSYTHTKSLSGYYIPVQLYEALFLFALFGVLTFLFFKYRSNITMHIYLIAYGIWRIIIEFFRADYRGGSFLGLSPSQWQSFVFIGLGVGLLIFYYLKKIPFTLPKDDNRLKVESRK